MIHVNELYNLADVLNMEFKLHKDNKIEGSKYIEFDYGLNDLNLILSTELRVRKSFVSKDETFVYLLLHVMGDMDILLFRDIKAKKTYFAILSRSKNPKSIEFKDSFNIFRKAIDSIGLKPSAIWLLSRTTGWELIQ